MHPSRLVNRPDKFSSDQHPPLLLEFMGSCLSAVGAALHAGIYDFFVINSGQAENI